MNNLFSYDVFIQLIGFVGVVLSFLVFQSNKRHKMLLLQTVSALVWSLHFFLLGAVTGSAMNFITAGRNYTYYKAGRNRNILIPLSFAACMVVAVLLTWQGPRSLLPMAGSLIGTLAFWQVKTHHIRLIVIVSPSLWLIYNVISGSYAGVVADTLVIFSIALGIYRFDVRPLWRRRYRRHAARKKLKYA
ncbi:MAG TPA: YgjV family protein [Candidatus Babeliales bacterium]|nr:YgjV family protein [Candidatus Babeliales bacterium]